MTAPTTARARGEPDLGSEQGVLLLDALRRHAISITILALVGGAVAATLTELRSDRYEASVLILVGGGSSAAEFLGGQVNLTGPAEDERSVANTAALLRSPRVAVEAARLLGRPGTEKAISDAVEVTPREDADVVEVRTEADSPQAATDIANNYAKAFRGLQLREQSRQAAKARRVLTGRLEALDDQAASGLEGQTLGTQIAQLRGIERGGAGGPRVIDAAEPEEAVKLGGLSASAVGIGALFGLLLGTGLALVRAQADRRLRTSEDLEAAFGVPVLVTVPRSRALHRYDAFFELPESDAEAFRILAARLRFADGGSPARDLLVTSAREQEGKSTVAWNLACAVAAADLDVALVETDLRSPDLARRQGLETSHGVAQVLEGTREIDTVMQQVLVEAPPGTRPPRTLDVFPSGPVAENPTSLLQSDRLPQLVEVLRGRYDLVIFDTPPITQVADAIPLAQIIDGVLIVARIGVTAREHAIDVRRQLADVGARVLGVAANGLKSEQQYGYGPRKDQRRWRRS